MKQADKLCYPILGKRNLRTYYEPGLTFRERLIIALASNLAIVSNRVGTDFVKLLIHKADAIIIEMENEKSETTST